MSRAIILNATSPHERPLSLAPELLKTKPAPRPGKPKPELDDSAASSVHASTAGHTALPVTLAAGYTWHRGVLMLNGEDVGR